MESGAPQAAKGRGQGCATLDWYKILFELIDLRSFSNLWYWIVLGVTWSMASHWVLGVPFDLIQRAHRHGGQTEADLEVMVRINADRLLYIGRTAGLWLAAFGAFLLTFLAVLAFGFAVEFAQALFLLLLPLTLLMLMSMHHARRIEAGESSGEALYRRLRRHRFGTQLLGMVSIFITSLFGMWQNMQIGFPY